MEPFVTYCADDSLLIEWIDSDCRFGISIEPNLKESSWYFVTKDYCDCGTLPPAMIERLKCFPEDRQKG